MFLENKNESELDNKLPQFLDNTYSEATRKRIAMVLRQLRNKIAHGDFVGFEKKIERYSQLVMDGQYAFDYSDHSRKNWVLLNACCLLESAVKRIIYMLFTEKEGHD